jgi:hypothetical protein
VGAAFHQKATGPTWPLRVRYEAGGSAFEARLCRSGTTGEDAQVEVPAPPAGMRARLVWRRHPTQDAYAEVPMEVRGDVLVGAIPSQLPAGKIEYHLVFEGAPAPVRVPAAEEDDPILRYKAPVPAWVLVPHILAMFLAMWVGVRAGIAALLDRPEARRLAWVVLGGLTLGGLVLGPIAQRYAFGAFWTGWPLGEDVTDNKVLAMWLAWLVACLVLGARTVRRPRAGRVLVVAAAVVMLAVYLIPHSLRGSQLDYQRLEQGVPAEDAIRTGQ